MRRGRLRVEAMRRHAAATALLRGSARAARRYADAAMLERRAQPPGRQCVFAWLRREEAGYGQQDYAAAERVHVTTATTVPRPAGRR